MKFKEMLKIGEDCGLLTARECALNVQIHAASLFPYEKITEELSEMMEEYNIFQIKMTAMGIALYVALSLCLQVPVFENYYFCLGYIVMLVYSYSFGYVKAALVGGIGCLLYCVLTNGLRGLPGWMLGNIFIGLALGVVFHYTKKLKNIEPFVVKTIEIVSIVIITAIGILLIKSMVEMVLYAQPLAIRIIKNMYAFIADVIVLVVSLPLCVTLDKHLYRHRNN